MKVTEKNAHPYEKTPHAFVAFASDLGIKAGEGFPQHLKTSLGNGSPFILIKTYDHSVLYRQQLGILALTVYND